ncbi:MAG: NAD(P)/FAD-dependent oxidoreductase [Prevotellaceae bacterium]|jgi:predicted Rossmann fold flavoprotein|nr:NAD(P)/FAD-dependent oxidoreductase [Prevotellaceae bacterium]
MQKHQVIVIGAGAAGLMAAIKAAQDGAKVFLLEKMEKPARKIRITGKGRCNITNMRPEPELMQKIHPNNRFFRPAFRNFSNNDLVRFLNENGLETIEERGERVFPASQKAWDVAETLIGIAEKQGVEIKCHAKVLGLNSVDGIIQSISVESGEGVEQLTSDAFVIATGGLSYPATGSTGDGYEWAKELGIEVVPTRPSLVGLYVKQHNEKLAGLELRNVSLQLWVDGGCKDEEFGELSFSSKGVEGAIVLRLSRDAVDALAKKSKVQFKLDLKPALGEERLRQRIQRELSAKPSPVVVEALLRKLLPAQLVAPFAEKAGVSVTQKTVKLKKGSLQRIVSCLKSFEMEVVGHEGYERAVITVGGISLNELDSKTMQAKKYANLFFAGEVIDLDGNTGGYNLQIAFSTGYLAGLSVAKLCKASCRTK